LDLPIRRALLSVSDKSGLTELARALVARGVELLSTGGSAKMLAEAGLPVTEVARHTGFPEIMDGRVKTLHPKIHGGLLGRRGVDDEVMRDHGIEPIDLLVVNLYPFAATIAKPDVSYDEGVENIDIGGPAMLRGAAKNHADVTVVVDPADYAALLEELEANNGATRQAFRSRLAAKAFAHTACYDSLVSEWLGRRNGVEEFPQELGVGLARIAPLRYGENPHQRAAFYRNAHPAPAHGSRRARNSRSTTSPMPTARSNACASSKRRPA
jgi:phosphoribosylaminoimidazolecarboxamide formyltransferase/IMP cyclohydrolase